VALALVTALVKPLTFIILFPSKFLFLLPGG
jgi:hypothetical protein